MVRYSGLTVTRYDNQLNSLTLLRSRAWSEERTKVPTPLRPHLSTDRDLDQMLFGGPVSTETMRSGPDRRQAVNCRCHGPTRKP